MDPEELLHLAEGQLEALRPLVQSYPELELEDEARMLLEGIFEAAKDHVPAGHPLDSVLKLYWSPEAAGRPLKAKNVYIVLKAVVDKLRFDAVVNDPEETSHDAPPAQFRGPPLPPPPTSGPPGFLLRGFDEQAGMVKIGPGW